MKQTVNAFAVTFIIVWCLGILALARAHAESECQEDQSCWNCHTMGNFTCGDFESDTGAFVGGFN